MQPIYIAIFAPEKVSIMLWLPSSVTVKSIIVVASTNPITECEAMECIFSKAVFIALESRRRVASMVIPRGIITAKLMLLIPADIGPYIPKNKRSVEELNPGIMKLSPHTTPQMAYPKIFWGIEIDQMCSQQ